LNGRALLQTVDLGGGGIPHLSLILPGSLSDQLRFFPLRCQRGKRGRPNAQAYIKHLLVLHVLTSHWPNPKSKGRNYKVTSKGLKVGTIIQPTTNVSRLNSMKFRKSPKVKSTIYKGGLLRREKHQGMNSS
jgi:hypothetical protein